MDDNRVLVAIMNNPRDFAIARDRHWYRISVRSAEKWARPWPPRWLAFYQTKDFGPEACAVHYYCRVFDIREVSRAELFPDNEHDEKAAHRYYQLILSPLQRLPRPIPSLRLRRITFIPTTWPKFISATEINELYNDSPLEDRLWPALRPLGIAAQRQVFVNAKRHWYTLDFAIYCLSGNLNIEADGIAHSDPERVAHDEIRDHNLAANGWKPLRFTSAQINERLTDYCIPTILDNIKTLGGPNPDPE